mgnify:CR=1 FL=1
MSRHTTLILLAVLLLIGIASAYTYKMKLLTLFQNSDFGLNLAISENNEGRSISEICVGDTHNVVGLVDYGATFSRMRITSTCDKYTGSYDCTPSEYNVISSSTASGAISFLTSGESNTIHLSLIHI